MEFGWDSLRGIYEALPGKDKDYIRDRWVIAQRERGYDADKEKRRALLLDVLVETGHIILPPPTPPTEAGAEEYEEILAAQALMQK